MFKKSHSFLFFYCAICETPNRLMCLSVKNNPQTITMFLYLHLYAFSILSLLRKLNQISEIAMLPVLCGLYVNVCVSVCMCMNVCIVPSQPPPPLQLMNQLDNFHGTWHTNESYSNIAILMSLHLLTITLHTSELGCSYNYHYVQSTRKTPQTSAFAWIRR